MSANASDMMQAWSLAELQCAMGLSPAAEDAARGIARHPLALRSAYAAVSMSDVAKLSVLQIYATHMLLIHKLVI